MQQAFVKEYLVDQNAYQAAIRAGYAATTAHSQSHVMLEMPEIKELVTKALIKQADNLDLSPEKVLKELAKIAFIDPRVIFDDNGELKPLSQIPKEARACIATIDKSYDKHGNVVKKVKLVSKIDALDKLGKHLKLFNDTVDINITVGLAERIAAARNRTVIDVTPIELLTDDGKVNE